MAVASRKRYSYADFLKFPDDGNRHEIVEGEWITTPAPEVPHQRARRRLGRILDEHAARHGLGEVFFAPLDVVLSPEDVVQPDLIFVSSGRAAVITRKNIQGAPDLVAEVLSPTTASIDRTQRRALYERAGAREYWIADPDARTLEIHEFGAARRVRIYQEGQSFESSLLPGLAVKLDEVFSGLR